MYNRAHTRRCRLGWYEPHSHNCSLCLANGRPQMCKSRILHRILATTRLIDPTIIYIGDGLNDYCPVLNVLRPRDYVLVRRGYALHTVLSSQPQHEIQNSTNTHASSSTLLSQASHITPLDQRSLASACTTLSNTNAGGCCSVGLWSCGKELLQLLKSIMENKSVRLPTLVRFRDAGANEFRSVTMNKRIPAVLKRTLDENVKGKTSDKTTDTTANVSSLAQTLVRKLIEDAQQNKAVPPLPGQLIVPAWLRNFAFTTEYDKCTDDIAHRALIVAHNEGVTVDHCNLNTFQCIAPRWGQIPWLHGEIYFYHLLWQYLLLRDNHNRNSNTNEKHDGKNNNNFSVMMKNSHSNNKDFAVNMITPYIIENPLSSQVCNVVCTQGLVSVSDIKHQNLTTDFLVRDAVVMNKNTITSAATNSHLLDRSIVITLPTPVPSVNSENNRDKVEENGSNSNVNKSDSISGEKMQFDHFAKYSELADPAGSGLLLIDPPSFRPYHDIFHREKADLLLNFLDLRVLPMLSCVPWEADLDFLPVLFRWMLWANGLDLSMFTLEQLSATHSHTEKEKSNDDGDDDNNGESTNETHHDENDASVQDKKKHEDNETEAERAVRKLREVEKMATMRQDNFLIANNSAKLVEYVRSLIHTAKELDKRDCTSTVTTTEGKDAHHESHKTQSSPHTHHHICNHIDIVMDNVGVECIADFCFGLWFLHHASNSVQNPTVTYHVKCMPYYVSDVTPRDVELLLKTLEQTYNNDSRDASSQTDATSSSSSSSSSPAEETAQHRRTMLRSILEPFVSKLREAFASGAFLLDADTVWTQPSEYRDLPPRIVNRYFYTQRVQRNAEEDDKHNKAELTSDTPARVWLCANKAAIEPRSSLVIFKGDLNYRRLIGDRYWDRSDFLSSLVEGCNDLHKAAQHYTSEKQRIVRELLQDTHEENEMDSPAFEEIVGAFWPTQSVPVCAIRTIKSECCVGVAGSVKQALDQNGKEWRISGKYGEILFAM